MAIAGGPGKGGKIVSTKLYCIKFMKTAVDCFVVWEWERVRFSFMKKCKTDWRILFCCAKLTSSCRTCLKRVWAWNLFYVLMCQKRFWKMFFISKTTIFSAGYGGVAGWTKLFCLNIFIWRKREGCA